MGQFCSFSSLDRRHSFQVASALVIDLDQNLFHILYLGRSVAFAYLERLLVVEVTTTVRGIRQEVRLGKQEGLTVRCVANRLLPYIYSYAWQANQTGAPLQRALAFEYQDDTDSYAQKQEYLFGQELLVAPVTTEGATTKQVYFPEGTWFDYDDGTLYGGKTTATVSAPMDKIPVFVKSGSIIPMAPAMTYTGQKAWDPITLDVYPDGDSAFTLYQDDGHSLDFQSGKLTTTQINAHHVASKSVQLTLSESNKQFSPKSWEFSLHLPAQTTTPSPIRFDDQAVATVTSQASYASAQQGSWWDTTKKVLWVKAAASGDTSEVLTVSLDGNPVEVTSPPDGGLPDGAAPAGGDGAGGASNGNAGSAPVAGAGSSAVTPPNAGVGGATTTTGGASANAGAATAPGGSGASSPTGAKSGCACSFARPGASSSFAALLSAGLALTLLTRRRRRHISGDSWRYYCDDGGNGHERSSLTPDLFQTWSPLDTLPKVGAAISQGTVIRGDTGHPS
jgi:hypothetical protein